MPEDKKKSGLSKDISSIFAGLEDVANGRGEEPTPQPSKPANPEAASSPETEAQPNPEEAAAPEQSARSEEPALFSSPPDGQQGETFVAGIFPPRKNAIIGLDIGRTSIRLVQVYPKDDGWEIGGVALKEVRLEPNQEGLDDEEVLGEALKSLVAEVKVRNRLFSCCLRGDTIYTSLIPLARMPKKELEGASRLEIKRRVSFDVDKAIIHNSLIEDQTGRPGAKLNYLVTVVRKEAVKKRIAIAQSVGIILKSLVPMPFSWKGLLDSCTDGSGAIMLVDIGASRTVVNIYKEGTLKFSREVATGGDQVTNEIIQAGKTFGEPSPISWDEAEKIKREHNLITGLGGGVLRSTVTVPQVGSMVRPVLERIVQECRRSLEYYDHLFREGKVARIFLTGGGALLPGFYSFFQERMTTPAELTLPGDKLQIHPSIQDREGLINRFPLLSRATSLALLQKPEVNFIPPAALLIQTILRSKAAIVLLAVFLLVLSFFFYNSKATQIPGQETIIAQQKKQIDELQTQLIPYQKLEVLKRTQAGKGKLNNYSQQRQPDWRGILKELSLITPPEIVLERMTLSEESSGGEILLVEGKALRDAQNTASPVTSFVVLMENSPFFRDVEEIKESTREGTFSFKCSLVY